MKNTPAYLRLQAIAVQAVAAAVSSGKLPSLSRTYVQCYDCTRRAQHYDHWDYNRKLDVEPVCRCCNISRGKTVNAPDNNRLSGGFEVSEDREWLDSLKAGDEVMVRYGFTGGVLKREVVERTTRTMIVVGRFRYRRKDGRWTSPSRWSPHHLVKPSKEGREEIEEREARQEIGSALIYANLAQLRSMRANWRKVK